jgi:hypothetical protein
MEKNCLKERRLGTQFLTNSTFQRECKMEEVVKAAAIFLTGEILPKHEIQNKNFKNRLILEVSNM